MSSIVRIEKLSHRYGGEEWAIRDINLEVDRRGVIGLLGSNGAGKSTTMNILCGVLRQTQGKIFIDGIDLDKYPREAKKQIGFLPQTAPLYLDLTVDEYLIHCAYLRLMEPKLIQIALKKVKEQCGIGHFSKRLIRNLSGGYRQRVGIAQAIVHTPKLVVMDEPTNGLDPNQITEVRKLIKEIASERAVIFSSHILSEIQATCSIVKMIDHGHMVFSDTMEAFNNYVEPNSLVVSFEALPTINLLNSIEGVNQVNILSTNTVRITFQEKNKISERLIEISVKNGWHLTEIYYEKSSLEEIFAKLSNNSLSIQV